MTSKFIHALVFLILAFLAGTGPVMAAQDDLRLEVARQWAEKGEYEKAVQELRLFLNEHPDAAEVYARIGSLRLRQGKLRLAADNFKVALAKDPSLAEARQGLVKVKEMEAKEKDPAPELPKAAKTAKTAKPAATPHGAPPDKDAYSPALDSSSTAAPQGLYALKEFLDALQQYREKKPDEALATLKTVLAKSPGHAGAYYLGGVIRYEKGDFAKAVYNLKRGMDYPHRGYNGHYYLGRISHKQNKAAEAIDAYGQYLKATRSEAGRKQAEAYLAQIRGKAPERHPGKTPEKHVEKRPDTAGHGPVSHADSGHGGKAHGHAAHPAGAPEPDLPPAPMVLSEAGYLPFVVADNAGASGRKLTEAYQEFKREKFEKSADLLKETIRLYGGSPNAEAAELDLAAVYVRLGLWDNARDRILDYLGKARDPNRYRDLAFYLEALMHLGKKDGEKAERALLKVKAGGQGGPDQEEIDYRMAQAGELMKDMKKWAVYLEKAQASARNPLRKARLWQQLAQLHGKHGRPDRAVEYFRKSMEKCGKPVEKAGKEEEEDQAGFPELCAESQLRIADMEFRRKRWKEALAEYKKFSEAYPGHKESAWAQYQMANAFQGSRNLESALNQYKRVIDNYPDSYWAAQARWKREDAIWRKEYEEVLD